MQLDPVINFGKVQVSTGYTSSATSIVLNSGNGAKLPASGFNLVWWNWTDYPDPADDPSVEIVRCTGRSTDTLTVTRAQESTSASNKNTAGKVYKMALALTALMIANIEAQTLNGTPIFDEQVSGSGTGWTLANTPVTGSVRVYAGTSRLHPTTDFSIAGDAITTVASYPTGALWADYSY